MLRRLYLVRPVIISNSKSSSFVLNSPREYLRFHISSPLGKAQTMSCHRKPVDITLITYSYTPASFNKPGQARVYTSFTFNTERSVRHAVTYWIRVGAGNYNDLDLLFCDGARFQEPHWSGLSKDGLTQLEANLREQKMEAVVQVVESLEALWEKAEYVRILQCHKVKPCELNS